MLQQHLLRGCAPTIGTEAAACRNDAVARHHDGKRVRSTGASSSAGGLRTTGGSSEARIGPALTEWDIAQRTLRAVAEGVWGCGDVEKQLKVPTRARKVFGDLLGSGDESVGPRNTSSRNTSVRKTVVSGAGRAIGEALQTAEIRGFTGETHP